MVEGLAAEQGHERNDRSDELMGVRPGPPHHRVGDERHCHRRFEPLLVRSRDGTNLRRTAVGCENLDAHGGPPCCGTDMCISGKANTKAPSGNRW